MDIYGHEGIYTILIYIEPQAKQSVRSSRGVFYTPAKKKKYVKDLVDALKMAKADRDCGSIYGRIDILFNFRLPKYKLSTVAKREHWASWKSDFHRSRPDRDNLLKPVQDAMQHVGYIKDDSNISTGMVTKIESIFPSFIALTFKNCENRSAWDD